MDYRILLWEENDAVRERYELPMERIKSMSTEEMQLPYDCYFKRVSTFIRRIERLAKRVEKTGLSREAGLDGAFSTLEELQGENHALYQDILPENYGESFANLDYAVEVLGDGYGQLLSFLYTEIRADIVYAFEIRLMNIIILNELFLEIYNLFVQAWEEERKAPQEQSIKDSLYWFVSDYVEVTVDWQTREGLDPAPSFGTDTMMKQDSIDPRYLYAYGEYVSETEIKLASPMNSPPQETTDQTASTYTEGFRKGSQAVGRNLKKERTAVVEPQLGFEHMIRRVVEYFREMGLEPICYRAAAEPVNRRVNGCRGYYGTSPSKQHDYDHCYDSVLYMGNAFKERKLAILRSAYEIRRKKATWCAGSALVETFGEEGFTPVNKKTVLTLNAYREALTPAYANESRWIANQYMLGDEISFTTIAFPKSEIGPEFEEVFREAIRTNTLDYEEYQEIQRRIIRALDEASHVLITGRGGNETHMKVSLHPLKDREEETNFENCVSDANIPLGGVFTSPISKGTEGLLHAKNVYVKDYQFRNLRMVSKDGKVTEYSCRNFEEDGSTGEAGNGEAVGTAGSVGDVGNGKTAGIAGEARRQGQALIKQATMRNHDWLSLSEFAIGTNTTVYAMARRSSIGDKLPILIAKKMGSYFAVGDIRYSLAEGSPMYNLDGREVTARDNEISLLRKTDMPKVYFGCHTDITIPYSELGDIKAVRVDGSGIGIIRQGKFVLDGTEELNEVLDEAFD